MRYSLRTLLILTILGPPVLAVAWLWGVPAFVIVFWPTTPPEDMIAAIVKSVGFALAAIITGTWAYHLRRKRRDRS